MNLRQFIASCLIWLMEVSDARTPFYSRILSLPISLFYPRTIYERLKFRSTDMTVLASIFIFGFVTCFGLQAYFAYLEGNIGTPDFVFNTSPQNGERVLFFDDLFGLMNNTLVIPLYLVAGSGFIASIIRLSDTTPNELKREGIMIPTQPRRIHSEVNFLGALVIIVILIQSSYAVDINTKSRYLFWFHGDDIDSRMTYSGYLYLCINFCLAAFVIFTSFFYVELYRWSKILRNGLRMNQMNDVKDFSSLIEDANAIKTHFAPFSECTIWAKAFATLLSLNIVIWQLSGVSGGPELTTTRTSENEIDIEILRLVLWAYLVIALFLSSFPRYQVQYEIFRIRRESGVEDYLDLRTPWVIGWSAFIDAVLLALVSFLIFDIETLSHLLR